MGGSFLCYKRVGKCKSCPLLVLIYDAKQRSYINTIEILYKTNTFDFDSMETLIIFSNMILPHRFNSIQSLQLDFRFSLSNNFKEKTPLNDSYRWEQTWKLIASMKALRHLWVRISWPPALSASDETGFLQELAQVKGLKTFEVSLPQVRGSEWEVLVGDFCV